MSLECRQGLQDINGFKVSQVAKDHLGGGFDERQCDIQDAIQTGVLPAGGSMTGFCKGCRLMTTVKKLEGPSAS